MGWITAVAIFFVIWWTVLFAILPLGVRSQDEDGEIVPGTPHSAPSTPRMGRKLLQTTLAAAVVFALFYLVTEIIGIGPDDFPHIIPGT